MGFCTGNLIPTFLYEFLYWELDLYIPIIICCIGNLIAILLLLEALLGTSASFLNLSLVIWVNSCVVSECFNAYLVPVRHA